MAYFDTHVQKVDKINAPLLIIGLGGTGADGVRRVKHEFERRFNPDVVGTAELDRPPRTQYLVLDTDPGEADRAYRGTKLDKNTEFISLQCSMDFLLANDGMNLSPEIRLWLDPAFYKDPDLRHQAATEGAGTFRQLSRLMLFHHANNVIGKIGTVMTTLASVPQAAPAGSKRINVAIVTGVCGGTGSGTFMDIAYLVRKAAENKNMGLDIDLYLVAPDLTISKNGQDPTKETIYRTNGFAALKELDYWMDIETRKTGSVGDHEFSVRYNSSTTCLWTVRPFNTVTMLCAQNTAGTLLKNAYESAMTSFAESMVFIYAAEAPKSTGDVIGIDNSNEDDTFSFQSQRSNEYAYRQALPHPYPGGYFYRAIGAYSNMSEERSRITIEGDLLFRDVKAYCELPEHQPEMAGTIPDAFFEAVYTRKALALRDSLEMMLAYDSMMFTKKKPWDLSSIKNMADDLRPHQGCFKEWQKAGSQAVAAEGNRFYQVLRQAFVEEADRFIHENGPKALRTLMKDPDHGILAKLNDKQRDLHGKLENAEQSCAQQYSMAQDWISQLTTLGFVDYALKSGTYFNNYVAAAEAQFIERRDAFFFEKMGEAVDHLLTDLNTVYMPCLELAIVALDEIADQLHADLESIHIQNGAGHVVTVQSLSEQILAEYTKNRNNEILVDAVMTSVCDFLDQAVTSSSHDQVMSNIISGVQEAMNNVYTTINNMSLSATLQAAGIADNGAAVQQYAFEKMAPQLEHAAEAHFALSPAIGVLTTQNAVMSSYVSIPQQQTDIRTGIMQYLQNGAYSGAVIKNSAISDRVFWLNIHSGLPLAAYFYLEQYELTYLDNVHNRHGVHLLMTNDPKLQDINHNWKLIPSPNPYMFTQDKVHADRRLVDNRQQTEAILKRAEERGLLTLNCNAVEPTLSTATFTWLKADSGACANRAYVEAQLADVPAVPEKGSKNEQQQLEEQLAKLRSILNRKAEPATLMTGDYINERIAKFAKDQDVSSEFGQGLPEAIEKSMRAYMYYLASKRPMLVARLKEQSELVDLVEAEIAQREAQMQSIQGDQNAWNDFAAACKAKVKPLCQMMVFGELVWKAWNAFCMDYSGEMTEDPIFMAADDSPVQEESWAVYIPRYVHFLAWLTERDEHREPFHTLYERLEKKVKRANKLDPENSAEDRELTDAYIKVCEKIMEEMKKEQTKIRQNQDEIADGKWYSLAVSLIDAIEKQARSMKAIWDI